MTAKASIPAAQSFRSTARTAPIVLGAFAPATGPRKGIVLDNGRDGTGKAMPDRSERTGSRSPGRYGSAEPLSRPGHGHSLRDVAASRLTMTCRRRVFPTCCSRAFGGIRKVDEIVEEVEETLKEHEDGKPAYP
ncbi:hypothetical protein [Rhodovulum visakhapatnamense]|uniref:Uncharacterized protein n=1 Tax=Rhodovulum visakhapatnamense TaxID=364297 RepID=A0ABS1RIY2_9RHOB|nr:hypothetical protein [Rhodovulum visakhapatnamense]MBL3571463.1 hypothetical protein [Rhodovulum visakhapatnamense]MBL3579622.1 hypothetical protein [Rhodovulum visakhapatnamense]